MKSFKQFITEENESDSVFSVRLAAVLALKGYDIKKYNLDFIYSALDLDEKEIPRDQMMKGMVVELEHPDVTHGDPLMVARIAVAHIKEKKNYYDLLGKYVEKE